MPTRGLRSTPRVRNSCGAPADGLPTIVTMTLDLTDRRPWLRHYDPWVTPDLTAPPQPLATLLDETAAETPDLPATEFLGASLTWQAVKHRADALASWMATAGVSHGDRIGILLPNCPQYLITTFAVLRLGGVVVNINPAYTPREVAAMAQDAGLSACVTLDTRAAQVTAAAAVTPLRWVVVTALGDYAEPCDPCPPPTDAWRATAPQVVCWHDAQAPFAPPAVEVAPEDLAVLQYSGGTTGAPRAAMLTHANIHANVMQTAMFFERPQPRGGRCYLLVIPCAHVYGFTVGLLRGTWLAARLVLLPAFDPEGLLDAVRRFRPTYIPAVPSVFHALLAQPEERRAPLADVGQCNSGGAPASLALFEAWEAATGRPLNQGYGLSECSPVTHSMPHAGPRHPGTIGVPLSGTDMKIVDADTGTRTLPVGEVGELCICGPQVMRGYWRRPQESAAAVRTDADGRRWLYTGDLARLDGDGFTTIVQRKKDVILVDGFTVYPAEIEDVLASHPSVAQAAVVGLPDAQRGERIVAVIVPTSTVDPDLAALDALCREALARFKRPSEYHVRDTLPTSAAGKRLYRVLRDELSARP